MTELSVLDLAFIRSGSTAREALADTLDLARHVEQWGYRRFWLAEHHNMDGIASAATAVCIGYVAGGTHTMRVGAGGIMLPNHAPLVVAEQFGTLATLYPDRIDLGLGRAPGTDAQTIRALRRDPTAAERFASDVAELRAYLGPASRAQTVRAIPGTDTQVPLWMLGSSLYGAQLAAELGLPYAFASHFAPDALVEALEIYRERFRPSTQLSRPHVMVGVNVVVAAADAEATRLFTSAQQSFTKLLRGERGPLEPPIDDIERYWTRAEKAQVSHMLGCSFVGSPSTVRERLGEFVERTGADELIVVAAVYEHAARLRSYELLAQSWRDHSATPS